MCGIFGIISTELSSPERFCDLAEVNKQRGNLGFGSLILENLDKESAPAIMRHPTPFLREMIHDQEAQVRLGHIRAATGRRTNNPAEIHPFEASHFYLAHNGLLLNHNDYPQWILDPAINVDSQIILGGIAYYIMAGHSTVEAIQLTIEQLEGQQACWLWDSQSQQIYLWRVMSPIFINNSAEEIIFSSVRYEGINQLIDEGIIYQLDPQQCTLKMVGEFNYHSPYKV